MNDNYPVGICNEMCSEEEILRRERNGLLHILEIQQGHSKYHKPRADRNRVVKEFSRSAAGRNTQNVNDLRTVDALLQTVNYLLHDVITIHHVPWNIVYDFILDRLRAVRQDMIIQNLSRSNCISLLQPMIKFYVYSAYRMCEAPISMFDPYINNTHLQECLKRLLCLYDELDVLVSKISKLGDENVMFRNNILYSQCRPFMEALYLILNLGNTIAMHRALQLPSAWRTDLVQKCLKISIDSWRGNYVRVCKTILKLPPLLLACAVLHLPQIRKKALAIMSTAFSCKNSTFLVASLQKMLLYNDASEVEKDCAYFGIPVVDNKIGFLKSSFDSNKPQTPQKHSIFVDRLLSEYSIPDLLLCDDLVE